MTTELSDGILAMAVLRSVYASDGTLKVDADTLRRELREIGHAIVAVPEREISDGDLAMTQYGYHLKNGTADNLGAHQRAQLLAAGYHVTRVVSNNESDDFSVGWHHALNFLSVSFGVDAPASEDKECAANDFTDAIRKKFAPAEADSIEEQTQKTMDEIVFESAVYEAGLDVARWIFCDEGEACSPPSALKNRLSDAIDPEAAKRGELKPRQPKKVPTLEELRARGYVVHVQKEDGLGFVARQNELGIEEIEDRPHVAVGAVYRRIEEAFAAAIANGEDLPMPGEGK